MIEASLYAIFFRDVIVTVLAIVSAVIALYELKLRGKQRRLEFFHGIRERFQGDPALRKIRHLIEVGEAIPEDLMPDVFHYLGLFEEVAIAINDGLLPWSVARNFFGYYAVSAHGAFFGAGKALAANSGYWTVFVSFVQKLKSDNGVKNKYQY